MAEDAAEVRAGQRALVRRSYDAISYAYRSDDGSAHPSSAEDPGRYKQWIADLAQLIPAHARVVDLDTGTYLRWLHSAQLTAVWQRSIPEGNSGHTLILATAS